MSDQGELTLCWTITFHRRSKHSPQRLWTAIRDPGEVSRWMALPARIDLRVGGDYNVDFGPNAGELDGVIVRIEQERILAYVWGRSVIEWSIEPDGEGWTNEGIAAGWHGWLDALNAHLDGVAMSAEALTAHEKLEAPYRERIDALLKQM